MITTDELVRRGSVTTDVALAPFTTYKLGGAAAYFAEPATVDELRALIEGFSGRDLLLLGRGSNVVISDRGFDGLVIRLSGSFAEVDLDGDLVSAGGAVSLPVLARFAARAGRGGLEWCVGVPGSVGGAVRMNAGCLGSDISMCLDRAEVMSLRSGRIRSLTAADLELSYRHSNLGPDDAVVSAAFLTTEVEPAAAAAELKRITQWRREHQPGGTLNAGSVFKNPPGDAAGRLIDDAGLKGHGIGDVRVSPRHANFFEAGPAATAQQVRDLTFEVRQIVAAKTGVWLEPEVRFIGSFEPSPGEGMAP